MPKIQKQFHLELTVEQFLQACSHLELQEINLRLDVYLKKAEYDQKIEEYRSGKASLDPEFFEAEEVESYTTPLNQTEGIQSILQRAINTLEIEPLKPRVKKVAIWTNRLPAQRPRGWDEESE